ncbi:chromate transporter [Aquabacter sp. CN5-332]|uniref:chromate transporter n=1 Tax=Aquabacter sp. CN5-332 TaxID=3156608 RepID=UPI0032B574F1
MPDQPAPRPSATQLFLIFTRIGLTSFGGGLSGWFLREFVQDRKWMTEEEFLNGLAVSQALPGVNVSNMAIWIGYRLCGASGAAASFLGIIVPSAFVVVLIATLLSAISGFSLTHAAMNGAAAAAVGLSLTMGLTAARRVPRRAFPLMVMAAVFIAIGVLQWPLVWTVLVAGVTSVAISLWKS